MGLSLPAKERKATVYEGNTIGEVKSGSSTGAKLERILTELPQVRDQIAALVQEAEQMEKAGHELLKQAEFQLSGGPEEGE